MKRTISTIPQLYRHLRRWTEIVSILSKYGLADWLSHTKIEFIKRRFRAADGEILARLSQPARIRLALAELGPAFIKLGQLLSTRADLVGKELAEELTLLQTRTPADSFESVERTIEVELEKPWFEHYAEFDPEPMASASIGQVHRARMHDGREVMVKVQHQGIEKKIETDLEIALGLAHLAQRLEEFRRYQPVSVVQELARIMRRELDFQREFQHLVQFRRIFRRNRKLAVPEPIASHSSRRVLTMTRLVGKKFSDLKDETISAEERDQVARAGTRLYLNMIFDEGYYHADPHPGNLLLLDGNRIGLLDFGMVGRISEPLRDDIEAMLAAIVNQDVTLLVALIERVGQCPIAYDEAALTHEVADYVAQYSYQTAGEINMSAALTDFMAIVRRFQITLPSDVSLLIKVLITLEGTGQLLSPTFNLMEIMRPFQRTMMLKRMSPARQLKRMRRFYIQAEQIVQRLPSKLSNIIDQIQTGRFDIHLDHRRLGPSVNRLVMGLVTSALFLGSSLMLSYKVPPLWFVGEGRWGIHDLSLLGLTGCIVSILMGLRLMWAIRKSGNLDRMENS